MAKHYKFIQRSSSGKDRRTEPGIKNGIPDGQFNGLIICVFFHDLYEKCIKKDSAEKVKYQSCLETFLREERRREAAVMMSQVSGLRCESAEPGLLIHQPDTLRERKSLLIHQPDTLRERRQEVF